MGLKKKKIWISAFVIVVIAGAAGFFIRKHYYKPHIGDQPVSLEQILSERAKQADIYLDGPLGKAFFAKNWVEVKKLLVQAKRPHFELANVIRAGYIHSRMKELHPVDYAEIYLILIDLLEQKGNDPMGYDLLLAQFERLPLPPVDSEADKRVRKISNNSHSLLQTAVLQKWVTEAVPVPEDFLKKFTAKFPGQTDEENRNWLASVDQIRDVATQKALLERALQSYSKLKKNTQAMLLKTIAFSQSLPSKTQQLRQYSLQGLESGNSDVIESSLRLIQVLVAQGVFKPEEHKMLAEKLNAIPEGLVTPFANSKTTEIFKALNDVPATPTPAKTNTQ